MIKTQPSPKPMHALFSPDILAFGGLLVLLVIFYPGIFLAKEASLMGDHWEQHYPWAFAMADAIKHGRWLFWTSLIQCGFPIAAESQMGLFYIPNLIFYAILPFRWAYATMNSFHFFVAGWGTYLYCRRMGWASLGAFVAAVVFVFGTGYGGAYYNLTSLKTIAWFPWVLWALEGFLDVFRKRYVLLTAFFMSLALLAGYLQVAALMILICAVYFFLRIFPFSGPQRTWKQRVMSCGGVALALAGALVLALPQLLLTCELALFSNRVNLTEEYAYVGSLSPLALLTIVFPKLQGIFRGSCLYSGIFAIYFVVAAFGTRSQDLRKTLWLWVTVGIVSLMLALGGASPLYIALIKLSHFYSFRIPAKSLIFICFSIAMLAGIGVQAWRGELVKNPLRLGLQNRRYAYLMGGVIALWGIIYFFLTAGRTVLENIGKGFVINFIYGKSGHPRTLDYYFDAISGSIHIARELLSFTAPWQQWFLVIALLSFLWIYAMRWGFSKHRGPPLLLSAAFLIWMADLYAVAGMDIKKDFDAYQNVLKPNILIQTLLAEKEAGKVGRIYGFRAESENLPLIPSVNMLYGIEDVGGYSPLIMGRYFETLGLLGNMNDSNQVVSPEPSFALARLPLLNALDVSHVLAARELQHPDLELLARDPVSKTYLYRNRSEHARGYFVSNSVSFFEWPLLKQRLMAPGFDPRTSLLLESSEKGKMRGLRLSSDSKAVRIIRTGHRDDRETWFVETTGPGFFVLSNVFYPGWEVQVNGQKTPLLLAYGLFQAICIPGAGQYTVEFTYKPYRELGNLFRTLLKKRG